jgi:tetratricopeptide (TPR) repeat protein
MLRLKQLIHEIHRRSLWQVLGIYIVGGWIALQIVDTLAGALKLPDWAAPIALVLLIIGLPIVLATAFVQEGMGSRATGEVETTSGGTPIPSDVPQHRLFTWRNAILGGVVAFALLIGFAGGYVLIRDRSPDLAPDPLIAGEAAPGIAVLPFEVRGAGADVWREGMVDLLAKNLDGAAGLRAIDSRTVLARWREGAPGDTTPDAVTALEVARRTGARYAVLGSVVVAGDRLRAVADVYDLETGSRLGEAQVEGAADPFFAVADQFSAEVMRQIVGESREIPELDLARATTASLPALKAYLEGEALFRSGRFEDAVRAYRRAVDADSSFALAWLRLNLAYGWLSQFDLAEEAAVHAARLADQLPERDALLAQGANPDGRLETLEGLRAATRKYPDDPLAWHLLGEFVYHQGNAFLADPKEGQRAFDRAIELDPSFAAAYIHAINGAMATGPDSARAVDLLNAYEGLGAGGTRNFRELRLAQNLAFGDDATRARTLASLDTLSGTPMFQAAAMNLSHPRFLELQTAVLEAALGSSMPVDIRLSPWYLVHHRFRHGQVEAGLAALENPRVDGWRRALFAYRAHVSGLPVSAERLDRALAEASADDADIASAIELARGAWALERDRRDDYDRARIALETIAREVRTAGDTVMARRVGGHARGLEGFVAWRAGQPEEAERLLEEARLQVAPVNATIRWWLAQLALENGQPERAADLFLSLSHGTEPGFGEGGMAVLQLARLQEQLGRLDEARANYEWFVLAYRYADPELQPLVEDATARLMRLRDDIGE